MGRVPQLVAARKKDRRLGEPRDLDWRAIQTLEMDARIELIRELIPLGLAEVGRMLDEEVARLAGPRHGRKEALGVAYRHGSNPGSVRLGGQRLPVRVPRVRDEAGEVRLSSYAQLHGGAGEVDDGLFRKVLLGIRAGITRRPWKRCRERSGCRSPRCRGRFRRLRVRS